MDPLLVGDSHPAVALICRKLGVFPVSCVVGEGLVQRLRGFQRVHGLECDGVLDEELMVRLGIEVEAL